MSITIKEQKEAPLLSRKEVSAEAVFEGPTPSNEDVAKDLASKLGTKPELVVVKHIYTKFGETKAEILAYAYDSKEELDKIETHPKMQPKKKAAAEAPAEAAPAAEAPAEEKKEEPKAEEKKE